MPNEAPRVRWSDLSVTVYGKPDANGQPKWTDHFTLQNVTTDEALARARGMYTAFAGPIYDEIEIEIGPNVDVEVAA